MTHQISSCYRLVITLAFFLCAAASLPASAGQPVKNGPGEPSITVKFGDLDLNTDAGRRELLKRLSRAADRVCRDNGMSPNDALGSGVWLSCYSHTLAAAVKKVHHVQLSELFAATSYPKTR